MLGCPAHLTVLGGAAGFRVVAANPYPLQGRRHTASLPGLTGLALGGCFGEPGDQRHPVGKPRPWPVWEPRRCRLLPTAWLSRFPSGLDSSPLHSQPPKSPGSHGGPWQSWPSVPHAASSQAYLQTPWNPVSLGEETPQPPRSSTVPESVWGWQAPSPPHCTPRLHSELHHRLRVRAVVFAAGLGRGSSRKASRVLTV